MGNILGRIIIIISLLSVGFFALVAGIHYTQQHETHVIVIGAGAQGGEANMMVQALASLAKKHDPLLNIVVAETGGSGQNNRMLEAGHLHFAAIQADTKASPKTRLVTMFYPDAYQLLVSDDAGVDTFADLKGKRIALPNKESGQYRSFFFLANHYGLGENDFKILNMSSSASSWALSQGAVDAIFRVRAPGNAEIKALITKGGVKLLPISHSQALRLEQPAIRKGVIPKGSYRGDPAVPKEDLPTPTVQRLLVASEDTDPEIVQRVTRLIYENLRELSDYSPLAGFIADDAALASAALPLHKGAQSYYERDNPGYFQENVEVFAFYLTVLAGVVSLLLQMNGRKQKDRVDNYNRQLIGIYNEAVDDMKPEMQYYRNKMMKIFARVIKDSEDGNLTSNGFEFLSFTWDEINDSIIAMVKERI